MNLDRTSVMGLFPHDDIDIQDLEQRSTRDLVAVANDPTQTFVERDSALWNLRHRDVPDLGALALHLALADEDQRLRRSATWCVFKLGNTSLLQQCLAADDSGNTSAWKQHLIHEASGTSAPFDKRSIRRVDSPFDVTVPLAVEGVVQFRDNDDQWYKMIVPMGKRTGLVGQMTAAVNARTFLTELVIQKRIHNIMRTGRDFVDGYLFKGLSRTAGASRIVHYYQSIWKHDLFRSGRTGDRSAGVISNVLTHLFRTAETDITLTPDGPLPIAVRGIFYGPVFMNPAIVSDKTIPLDGLLQIVAPTDYEAGKFSNGWFYGTFRGVPWDFDNDGQVEINGAEMFVDPAGRVIEQSPASTNHRSEVV